MIPPRDRRALASDKAETVLHTLMKCARLVNERAMARVNDEAGRTLLRPTITALLPHIDLDGTRIGDVARRGGMSKQQTGQLIAELETVGFVETLRDPNDGRARIVRFTRQGVSAIQHGLAVLRGLEHELERQAGPRAFTNLRRALPVLLRTLERD